MSVCAVFRWYPAKGCVDVELLSSVGRIRIQQQPWVYLRHWQIWCVWIAASFHCYPIRQSHFPILSCSEITLFPTAVDEKQARIFVIELLIFFLNYVYDVQMSHCRIRSSSIPVEIMCHCIACCILLSFLGKLFCWCYEFSLCLNTFDLLLIIPYTDTQHLKLYCNSVKWTFLVGVWFGIVVMA